MYRESYYLKKGQTNKTIEAQLNNKYTNKLRPKTQYLIVLIGRDKLDSLTDSLKENIAYISVFQQRAPCSTQIDHKRSL
jgi:hypothetical protein